MEINAIKQGQSPLNGMKLAQVGFWGGIIVILLQIVGFLFWLLLSMVSAVLEP
jgi:hypothetical protein